MKLTKIFISTIVLIAVSAKINVLIPPVQATTNFYGHNLRLLKVFGQISYKEGSRNTVTGHSMYHGAGVKLDHRSQPNHIYVVDTGNSRILAFENLGICQESGKRCNTDDDCRSGFCLPTHKKDADLVFGQPDLSHGACNRDVNKGVFGQAGPDSLCFINYPVASNIAEMWQRVNIDVDKNGNLYVPDFFNNRVLIYNDPFSSVKNNGQGDTIADYVIGQPNFQTNQANQGQKQPDSTTIHIDYGSNIIMSHGVSVDKNDNVWLADTFNRRVLRFSHQEIVQARLENRAPRANLVLGQDNFESITRSACNPSLASATKIRHLCQPTLARLNPITNELYVLDETMATDPYFRRNLPFQTTIFVFKPDSHGNFHSGQATDRVIKIKQPLPFEKINSWPIDYFLQATSFEFNLPNHGFYKNGYQRGSLWITEHQARRVLLVDNNGNIIKIIGAPDKPTWTPESSGVHYRAGWQWDFCYSTGYCLWPGGSFDFDENGNIYLSDESGNRALWFKLPYQTSVSTDPNNYITIPKPAGFIINDKPHSSLPNEVGPHKMDMTNGLIASHNQLIIRGKNRFLVWPDYINAGYQDNFIVGQTDPYDNSSDPQNIGIRAGFAVTGDWLWSFDKVQGHLVIYQLPLSASSQPLSHHPLNLVWADNKQNIYYRGSMGLAYNHLLDALFVSDVINNRILVIKNYSDFQNGSLTVNMVIGQPNKNSSRCNHHQDGSVQPAEADGLCLPREIKFDRNGNLFVVENDYESHGNNRISVWKFNDIKQGLDSGRLFPQIKAVKVFTQESLTGQVKHHSYLNRPSSPVDLAFDKANHMVVANDGSYMGYGYHANNPIYDQQRPFRQLWFYQNPLAKDKNGNYIQNQPADAYIDLPIGVPGGVVFDKNDNLITHDGTWSRVFVVNLNCDPDLVKPLKSNFAFQPGQCFLDKKGLRDRALDVNLNDKPADRGDVICFISKYLRYLHVKLQPDKVLYDPNNDHYFNRQDVIQAIIAYLQKPIISQLKSCAPVPKIN